MTAKTTFDLSYVIRFVENMAKATAYHRDVLGMPPQFESPFWTEFGTKGVRLALHPATEQWPAGLVQLGYACEDLEDVYERREELGLTFVTQPTLQHGVLIGTIVDAEGNHCRVGERRV